MAISVSQSAAKHISDFLSKRGKGMGIRLGVRTSGCSGMAYKLEFVDELHDGDIEFDRNGVKVYTDANILTYQTGTALYLFGRCVR